MTKAELFPAHAGVIPTSVWRIRFFEPFPRARGGDPKLARSGGAEVTFSPRTRG